MFAHPALPSGEHPASTIRSQLFANGKEALAPMTNPHEVRPGIRLRDLLPEANFIGAEDVQVVSCSSDSRSCQPGDLFVAVHGENRDGHDYIADALARGASALIVERPVQGVAVPVCVVRDSREALGRICQALAGHPSQRLKVIGVTGTNGKTTTSYLIAGVLGAGDYPTGVMGTLGCSDGRRMEPMPAGSNLTTPTAPVLARWLDRIAEARCTHAVMEVSSHALVQNRVAGINFDMACVTNVRHDHLDYHGNWDNYARAKERIFEHLLPEGVAVINADDHGAAHYLDRLQHPTLTIGINRPAEISGHIIEQSISDQTFLLTAGSETMPVRTALIGTHNVYNCLIAAAVGFAYGLDMATVVRGLESVETVSGRLERVDCGQPFNVLVDYAHTPDALEEVLSTLRPLTRGRLICVFGAGGDRDRSKRPWMGRAVDRLADVTVITSDNPRTESPEEIAADLLTGFRRPALANTILDRHEAIAWALRQAEPGDTVVVAGKGHETYQIIGDETLHFDDREVIRDTLYAGVPASPRYRRAG